MVLLEISLCPFHHYLIVDKQHTFGVLRIGQFRGLTKLCRERHAASLHYHECGKCELGNAKAAGEVGFKDSGFADFGREERSDYGWGGDESDGLEGEPAGGDYEKTDISKRN